MKGFCLPLQWYVDSWKILIQTLYQLHSTVLFYYPFVAFCEIYIGSTQQRPEEAITLLVKNYPPPTRSYLLYTIYLTSILILSSHLWLCFAISLFVWSSSTNMLHAFLIFPIKNNFKSQQDTYSVLHASVLSNNQFLTKVINYVQVIHKVGVKFDQYTWKQNSSNTFWYWSPASNTNKICEVFVELKNVEGQTYPPNYTIILYTLCKECLKI